MVNLMPSALKHKTANETADEFIGFIKKKFLRHIPQNKPAILNEFETLEREINLLAEELSADKQRQIAEAYRKAGLQISKPANYEKWEKRAAEKAKAEAKLSELLSKDSVTERLLTETSFVSMSKLISAEDEEAHLYYVPGKTKLKWL